MQEWKAGKEGLECGCHGLVVVHVLGKYGRVWCCDVVGALGCLGDVQVLFVSIREGADGSVFTDSSVDVGFVCLTHETRVWCL